MSNILKTLFLMQLIIVSLYAETPTLDEKKMKYIKDIPTQFCEPFVRDDNKQIDENGLPYKFILDDFNYKTGYIKFIVYKQDGWGRIDLNKKLDTIAYTNKACVDEVRVDIDNVEDKTVFDAQLEAYGYTEKMAEFRKIRDTNDATDEFNLKLKQLEKRYLNKGNEFTTTGDKKFLTTSSYLLACLTFNEDIINIKKSLELNKIVLQDEYTIYPNKTVIENEEVFQSNHLSSVGSSVRNYRTIATQKLTSISQYLSDNVILFVFKFRADMDPLLLKIKTTLFFTFLPLSVGLLGLTKITKKVGDVTDFDDVWEKVAMIAVLFVGFYVTGDGHKVQNKFGEEKAIHLNHYQDWANNIFSKSMEFADESSNIFAKSYIDFKRKSAGFSTDAEIQSIIIDSIELSRVKDALYTGENSGVNLTEECAKTYNLELIKAMFDLKSTSYPNSIQYERFKKTQMGNVTQFLNSNYNEYTNIPKFTPPLCNKFERRVLEINKQLEINKNKLDASKQAVANKDEQNQLLKIATVQYRTSAELGVISIPQTAVTNIVTDNLNMFGGSRDNQAVYKEMERQTKEDNLDKGVALNIIFENLAYMMLPGASTAQELFSLDSKSSITSSIFTGYIGNAIVFASELGATALTIWIMQNMVDYFPVIALSMASLMVISWYFISAFTYFLVSPFIIVYAMSSQQTEIIKNFVIRGIALAFKPILIVFSIVIAITAVYLINDLSIIMFEGNFNLLIDTVKSSENSSILTLIDYLLMFFKGIVMVGSSVVGVLSAFYLVFNGAEMILGMFGFKETGIDIKEIVGSSVENKTSKFNTPV